MNRSGRKFARPGGGRTKRRDGARALKKATIEQTSHVTISHEVGIRLILLDGVLGRLKTIFQPVSSFFNGSSHEQTTAV